MPLIRGNIFEYEYIKKYKQTRHEINYMELEDRAHNHKSELKKDTNQDNFENLNNPVTPENHKSMTSQLNVIKKRDQMTPNQVNIDSEKQTKRIKTMYNKKLENRNYK